jgi:DNA-binding transcriptional regulator YhcF (GntR family)
MARKEVERSLPSLRALMPRFRGFAKGSQHQQTVTSAMRSIARKLRRKKNQPFYSMREAARFWSLPLSSISMVYKELEDEGLLIRVRGSRTVLLGREVQTHHTFRSIVSVPIALNSLVSSHFTRRFCDRISDELWKHHFVANLILVRELDDRPSVMRRLLTQSDIVIWLFPYRDVRMTMLSLRDHGVRNVIVRPVEHGFMPAQYLLDWTPAYKQAALEWKNAGIEHVVVAKSKRAPTAEVLGSFLSILRHAGLSCSQAEGDPRALREQIEKTRQSGKRAGCAILSHEDSHIFCNSEPGVMAQIARRSRLLLGRGRINAPYFFTHSAPVDVIGFSGDEIARRIAHDLGARGRDQESVRLLPNWMPRAKLDEVV